MKTLKIELIINGAKKVFVQPFVSAKWVREAIRLSTSLEKGEIDETDSIDSITAYLVGLFGNQFTVDELLDGLDVADLMPEFTRCLQLVGERLQEKVNKPAPNK